MEQESSETGADQNRSSGSPTRTRPAGPTVAIADGGAQGAPGEPAKQQYCSNCGTALNRNADVCPQCGISQDSGKDAGGGRPSGRYISGVVGALAAVFLGWLPLIGLIVGGAIAGYLRGSDNKESAISGLVAHGLASIPLMAIIGFFFVFGGIGVVASGDGGAALGLFIWAGIFVVGFVFYFVMGAIGGVIGAALTSRAEP
jgi:hypothetical protein